MKNQFCVWEIFSALQDEQWIHSQQHNQFIDFQKIAAVTKNKRLQKFTKNIKNGVITWHGYNYYIYLLSGSNIYPGGVRKDIPKNKNFICYAWPVKYKQTGIYSFAIDHIGWVYLYDNKKYSGNNKPLPKACFYQQNQEEYWVTAGSDAWHSHAHMKKKFICD